MSLKIMKQAMLARPSKSSFISDFDTENSSLFSEKCIKPSIYSHFNHKQNNEEELLSPENNLEENGNEETIVLSKQSNSDGKNSKNLKLEDLGPFELSSHSRALVNRVLWLYNSKLTKKMKNYYNKLHVFNSKTIAKWALDSKIVYNSIEFNCFDVLENTTKTPLGFFNGYTSLQSMLFPPEKDLNQPIIKSLFPLENDCYSLVHALGSPFTNSSLLGLFSGSLTQVDILKEKIVKTFLSINKNNPFNVAEQKETSFFVGDVGGCVQIFDYRVKSLIEKLSLSPKDSFNPVVSLDTKENFLLANDSRICKIWDLRLLEKPLIEKEFSFENSRKMKFINHESILEVIPGKSSTFNLDFSLEIPKKFIDFKEKKVLDVAKIPDLNAFGFLIEGQNKKSEIYCYGFDRNRNKKKVLNYIPLEKPFKRMKFSEKAEMIGLMSENDFEMIAFYQKKVEKDLKTKLKALIT